MIFGDILVKGGGVQGCRLNEAAMGIMDSRRDVLGMPIQSLHWQTDDSKENFKPSDLMSTLLPVYGSGNPTEQRIRTSSTVLLKAWLISHRDNPYPTQSEKQKLMDATGLKRQQLDTWFVNARRRLLGRSSAKYSTRLYRFGPKATRALISWLIKNPRINPKGSEMEKLTETTGLNVRQVKQWYSNARKRNLRERVLGEFTKSCDIQKLMKSEDDQKETIAASIPDNSNDKAMESSNPKRSGSTLPFSPFALLSGNVSDSSWTSLNDTEAQQDHKKSCEKTDGLFVHTLLRALKEQIPIDNILKLVNLSSDCDSTGNNGKLAKGSLDNQALAHYALATNTQSGIQIAGTPLKTVVTPNGKNQTIESLTTLREPKSDSASTQIKGHALEYLPHVISLFSSASLDCSTKKLALERLSVSLKHENSSLAAFTLSLSLMV